MYIYIILFFYGIITFYSAACHFPPLSVDGHLSWFLELIAVNNATLHMAVQAPV